MALMATDLAGRVALVTGATSGIGAAVAQRLGAAGARLVLTGRNEERAAALAGDLAGHGIEALAITGDVTDAGFCDRLVARTVDELGSLDILVNSAGVFRQAPLAETDDALWREVMAVNVDAVFTLCRAAVRHMVGRGGGVIVNVAGDWGIKPAPDIFAYSVGKAAVIHMARSITADYARHGVRINTVCPGDVDTPMLDELAREQGHDPDEVRRASREKSPNRRLASPEDIAAAVVFLTSDDARHITGVALPVEGGGLAI
jgi:meso-butanediol dehydrogenase/(S,S)-butanediol dehydrogenase/diacetyl reductase